MLTLQRNDVALLRGHICPLISATPNMCQPTRPNTLHNLQTTSNPSWGSKRRNSQTMVVQNMPLILPPRLACLVGIDSFVKTSSRLCQHSKFHRQASHRRLVKIDEALRIRSRFGVRLVESQILGLRFEPACLVQLALCGSVLLGALCAIGRGSH